MMIAHLAPSPRSRRLFRTRRSMLRNPKRAEGPSKTAARALRRSSLRVCEALEQRMLLAVVPILREPSELTSAPASFLIAPTPIGTPEIGSAPDVLPHSRLALDPYQWPVGAEARVNSYTPSSQY